MFFLVTPLLSGVCMQATRKENKFKCCHVAQNFPPLGTLKIKLIISIDHKSQIHHHSAILLSLLINFLDAIS